MGIARFKVGDNETIYVESSEVPEPTGESRAGLGDQFQKLFSPGDKGAVPSLDDRVKPLAQALATIRDSISSVVTGVNDIEVEAGLKFIGEAGVILSKVGSEASVKITLKWSRT